MGFLVKSSYSSYYEVCPTEGGHTDFAPTSEEDFDFFRFTKKFIEESNNIENKRAKGPISRVSIERVGAGPAVPMLYKFLEERNKDLENVFEKEGKPFDDLTSVDIIEKGMNAKDPLCMKVIEKFTQIIGIEAGNFALKTLPFGGLYLIGGVTNGIRQYLIDEKTFMQNFEHKGRLSDTVKKIPVYVVNPEIECGILGAEEVAYRLVSQHQ